MVLTESMFAATEMVAGGEVAFEAMTVDQLKVELAERGSTPFGAQGDPAAPPAWCMRSALIVQAAIEQSRDDMDI